METNAFEAAGGQLGSKFWRRTSLSPDARLGIDHIVRCLGQVAKIAASRRENSAERTKNRLHLVHA